MPHHCFVHHVRRDRLDAYRDRHREVWPAMLRALRDAGWRDYRLYLGEDGLLVGHVEADDLDAAQAAMERTAVNERWQAAMAEFFDGGRPDTAFRVLEPVFHLESQLARLDEPDR
ncbi:L-rhamnose mutarotase [Actinomycetospora lutea]|uniref:L-rhamnose mutarotase n=1 Tax=Actinomycetospora lutea TaxID=663604 RepID=UPI002366197C|nr:L-rhamnose mutarotase [Actinomycetospora lutea]MDD7939081.1 L-rhamnose mutarotase [Actinomycetospora lutea]